MAFSAHDVVLDSPTNTFATLNPLQKSSSIQLSEGNLDTTVTAASYHAVLSTIAVSSGKWYFEGLLTGNSAAPDFGFCIPEVTTADIDQFTASIRPKLYGIATDGNGGQILYFSNTGSAAAQIDQTPNSGGWSSGDIVSVYADFDIGKIRFAKNGVWYDAELSFPPNITLTPRTSGYQGYNSAVNFGQDPTFGGTKSPTTTYTDANGIGSFYYEPPTGALALCTANLPDPTIDPAQDDVPEDYMKAVAYTGASADKRIDLNFQPDLVWIKHRSALFHHRWHDSVRGWEQYLGSSTSGAEFDLTSYGDVFKNIDSTGFTLPNGTNAQSYNDSAGTYVTWCWKAGGAPSGSPSTIGSAKRINTSGTQDDTSCSALASAASATITPTLMSINQKSGFSIVKYTGTGSAATVPHGLNAAPELIITKGLTTTYNWNVCTSLVPDSYLEINTTSAKTTDSSRYISAGIDKNTLTDYVQFNQSGVPHIAYCWHSVAGYSKFGSYTGNGSTDGPFVYTGFRPAWVMVKRTDVGNNWVMQDTKRDPYNVANATLLADRYDVETDFGIDFDYLSNGFKIRSTNNPENASGGTYIYAAFAEQPFKYANAR